MTKKKTKYGYVKDYWKLFRNAKTTEDLAYFIANSIRYSIQDNGINTNMDASDDLDDLEEGIIQLLTPIFKEYEKSLKEETRKKEKLA